MTIQDLAPLLFIVAILVAFHFLRQKMVGEAISPMELSERLKTEDIKLIDVRSEPEYEGELGHIEGAVNIPVGNLAEEIVALDKPDETQKNETIVTICRTHNRSPRAARMLKDVGFRNVLVLKGGMMSWNNLKLPVVKS